MKLKVEILNSKSEIEGDGFVEVQNVIWTSKQQSLLDLLLANNIKIDHSCDGHATCGTCQIQLIEGTLSEKSELENDFSNERPMQADERLSCQCYPQSNILIKINSDK